MSEVNAYVAYVGIDGMVFIEYCLNEKTAHDFIEMMVNHESVEWYTIREKTVDVFNVTFYEEKLDGFENTPKIEDLIH